MSLPFERKSKSRLITPDLLYVKYRTGQFETEAEQQYAEWAFTDSLTKVANRKALELHFSHLVMQGACVAISMRDIHAFKKVNERRGHAGGDIMLQQTAAYLAENTRTRRGPNEDIVGRIGGDEFITIYNLNDISTDERHNVLNAIDARKVNGYLSYPPIQEYNESPTTPVSERLSLYSGFAIHQEGMTFEELRILADVDKERIAQTHLGQLSLLGAIDLRG